MVADPVKSKAYFEKANYNATFRCIKYCNDNMIIENLISFLYTCVKLCHYRHDDKTERYLAENDRGIALKEFPTGCTVWVLFTKVLPEQETAHVVHTKNKKKKRTLWKPCGNYREKRTKKKKRKWARRLSGRKLQGQTVFLIGLGLE